MAKMTFSLVKKQTIIVSTSNVIKSRQRKAACKNIIINPKTKQMKLHLSRKSWELKIKIAEILIFHPSSTFCSLRDETAFELHSRDTFIALCAADAPSRLLLPRGS